MPDLSTDDGVELYYEEIGGGAPIVFVHQFAGDYRSWEPQVRHFARRYRCIALNARGYALPTCPPGPDTARRRLGGRSFEAVIIAGRLTKKGMAALADFIAQVDGGRWPMRDPCQPEHHGNEIAN